MVSKPLYGLPFTPMSRSAERKKGIKMTNVGIPFPGAVLIGHVSSGFPSHAHVNASILCTQTNLATMTPRWGVGSETPAPNSLKQSEQGVDAKVTTKSPPLRKRPLDIQH
jgi:hypothetical protein